MQLTLQRVKKALAALHLDTGNTPVIQVVGTNGKGSTVAFLAALAQAYGLRTGTYTSPHFVSPQENIRINGVPLAAENWVAFANNVYSAEPTLTHFEFLTVLAMHAFVSQHVDIIILEAGLGGRMDATSAVRPEIICYTPIALDHEHILGTGLAAIATDKACAIKPHMTVITADQDPLAMAILVHHAQKQQATLLEAKAITPLPPLSTLGLQGPHQACNAQLALATWHTITRKFGWTPTAPQIQRGLQTAFIAGRMQLCPASPPLPKLLLDGAHNAHSMNALRQAIDSMHIKPCAVIFSCLQDKALDAMLPHLRSICRDAPVYVPTITDNNRAWESTALARHLGGQAIAVQTLHAALQCCLPHAKEAPDKPVLICGSLYLLGEFFAAYPCYLTPPENIYA